MLDVDGLKERFNAKNSHAQVGHSRFSFLADHVWAACARKDVRGGGLFAGIRDVERSRGLGDVYKRQITACVVVLLPQSLYLKDQRGHWVCWMRVCSSHQTVLSTRRHPAHPVSVPILPPREIQALWLSLIHI